MSATVSAEGKKGCFYIINEAPEIIQSACILKRTTNRALRSRGEKSIGKIRNVG
jgi:hypothetical protein